MTHITFIDNQGVLRTVEIDECLSVMEGAMRHRIPGIDGDCGGACACATCHVYVEPAWLDRLAPPDGLERAMLKMALEPNAQSRLACRIKVERALDGLVVRTPKSQY